MAKRFTARLRSVGNPDFSQYAPVSNPETVEADTLDEIVQKWVTYQTDWNLGGGNCPEILVKEGEKVVARLGFLRTIQHPKRKRPLSAEFPTFMVRDGLTTEERAALNTPVAVR